MQCFQFCNQGFAIVQRCLLAGTRAGWGPVALRRVSLRCQRAKRWSCWDRMKRKATHAQAHFDHVDSMKDASPFVAPILRTRVVHGGGGGSFRAPNERRFPRALRARENLDFLRGARRRVQRRAAARVEVLLAVKTRKKRTLRSPPRTRPSSARATSCEVSAPQTVTALSSGTTWSK